MNNLFVARIHNNSLGRCILVNDTDEAEQIIREWVRDQFGREITDEENENLVNNGEFYNDDDVDNVITFSIGILTA
jgi:hypothetical protein